MNEVSLHCTECPFKTNSSRKLGRHTALAHANWKYRCPLCPFDSCYVASLYRHKKEVHQIGLNNQTDLQNFEYPDEDDDPDDVEMLSRSGDKMFTRSSPKTVNRPRRTSSRGSRGSSGSGTPQSCEIPDLSKELLPCRIQRRYQCTTCDLQTRNPRDYLYHLRDVHGEKLKVYECNHCLYASRHQQKLQRHVSFGHSTKVRNILPTAATQSKHPVAKKTMTRPRARSPTEEPFFAVVKSEMAENDENQYNIEDNDYSVTYQSDGYPEMFPPEEHDYHMNDLSYESTGANNYMENLYNVQLLEEPPEEEILEIIDGEVDEVMNMSSQDVGSPIDVSPNIESPIDVNASVGDLEPAVESPDMCHQSTGSPDVVWKSDEMLEESTSASNEDHKCSKCSFKSKSKLIVQRHEKVKHMKRKSFRCVKCNYVTNVRGRYTKHMKYHDLPYIKCDMCDFKTPYRWNMDRHMKNHTTEGTHRCSQCSFAADTKQSLSFHTFNHHHDGDANQANKDDIDCGRKTVLYSELAGLPSIANDDKSTVPDAEFEEVASSVVESGKRRAPYVNLRAVAVRKSKFKRRFRCPFCSHVATSRTGLYRHKAQHKADTLHKDSATGQVVKSGYMNMENVIRQEGTEKPLKCKLCAYEAKWISEMVKHQRIHTHEKPFVCPFCGFRSRWKGDMTRHIQKYHKENKKTENSYSRPFLTTRKRRKLEEQEAFDRERNQEISREPEGTLTLRNQPPRFRKRRSSNTPERVRRRAESDQDDTSANLVITTSVSQTADMEANVDKHSEALTSEPTTKQSKEEGNSSSRHTLRVLRRHYRCPHCKFSAATASRFHVHIVAHFNKRPYMCSECGYRSNWQWDITKHIRLKIARQQTHYNAKLETLNEFGNRNYEKYIKYVVYDDSPIADEGQVNASDGLDLGETAMKLRPTYWKCKQCPYTSSNKRSMLYHLPKHCQNRPFYCGECGQASRWRENVERHCRLQHGNIIRMIENRDAVAALEAQGSSDDLKIYDDMTDKEGFVREASSGKEALDDMPEETNSESAVTETAKADDTTVKATDPDIQPSLKRHACNICPYRTRKLHDMQLHMKMHQPQPGTIFKCMFCPFYTSLRRSLLQHMKLHVSKPHEYISNALDSTPDQDDEIDVTVNDENDNSINQQTSLEHFASSITQSHCMAADVPVEPAITISESDPAANLKRYSCDHCPYTSDSKTQYLYHKQFHRNSRSCPFKCPHCNYAVTRGHLLMQHIRLHKIKPNSAATVTTQPVHTSEKPSISTNSTLTKDTITIHSNVPMQRKTGIPMVWVSKGSTSMVKMYKCRYCPHVNKRRSNIREHEKMHRKRRMTGRYSCTYCTYVCNNQGVLSNHIKVHQNTSQVSGPATAASPLVNNYQLECATAINAASEEANETVYLPPLTKSNSTNPVQKVLFVCDICPERFTRSGDLRIHGKFHQADLPWKCTHCSYSAKHRSQLYRHMKVHSPNYIGRSCSAEVATEEATNQPLTVNSRPASPRVTSPEKQGPTKPGIKTPASENKHRCHLCPANFLKPSGLAYHLSLHGGTGKFKCPHCSYAVKNIGNLCRHTKVHDKARMKGIVAQPSGTSTAPSTTSSPQRDLSRRLECHKCPATFDKYTRYDIHIKLHGSHQRFTCDFCDYSVPFMANLMKHQKIHTNIVNVTNELAEPGTSEEVAGENPVSAEPSPKKTIQREPQDLSLSEQQMLMLLQHQQQMAQQQQQGADAKRFFFCDYCPYQHPRKDAVFSHMKRHDANQETVCPHCDYGTSTHSQAFIREHIKLHFQKPKRHHVDSYWKCEQAEVWAAETCGTSTLLFKDKGEDVDEINRFYYAGCETEPFVEEFVPDTVNSKLQVTICDINEQKMEADVAVNTLDNLTNGEENVTVVKVKSLINDQNISYVKPNVNLRDFEFMSAGTPLTNRDVKLTRNINEKNLTYDKFPNHVMAVWEDGSGPVAKPTQESEDNNRDPVCGTLLQKIDGSETVEQVDSLKVEEVVPTTNLQTQTDSLNFQISTDIIEAIIAKINYEEKLERISMLEVACGDLDSEESSMKIEETDLNTDAKDSVTSTGDVSSIELVLEESSTESVEMLPAENVEVKSDELLLDNSLTKIWNGSTNASELLGSTTETKDIDSKNLDQDTLIAELDNFSYVGSTSKESIIRTEQEMVPLNPEICFNEEDQVTSVKDLVTSTLNSNLTEHNTEVVSLNTDSNSSIVDKKGSNFTDVANKDNWTENRVEIPVYSKEHSKIFAQITDLNTAAALSDSKDADLNLKADVIETNYCIITSAGSECLNVSIPVEEHTNCPAESESCPSVTEATCNTTNIHSAIDIGEREPLCPKDSTINIHLTIKSDLPESKEVAKSELPESEAAAKPDMPESEEAAKSELLESKEATKPEFPDSGEAAKPEFPDSGETAKPEFPDSGEAAKPEYPESEEAAKPELMQNEKAAKPEIPDSRGAAKPELPASEEAAKPELPASEEAAKAELPASEEAAKAELPASEEAAKPEYLESEEAAKPELMQNEEAAKPEYPESEEATKPELMQNEEAAKAELPASEEAAKPEYPESEEAAKPEYPQNEEAANPELMQNEEATKPELLASEEAAKPELMQNEEAAKPELPASEEAAKPEYPESEEAAKPELPESEEAAKPEYPESEEAAKPELLESKEAAKRELLESEEAAKPEYSESEEAAKPEFSESKEAAKPELPESKDAANSELPEGEEAAKPEFSESNEAAKLQLPESEEAANSELPESGEAGKFTVPESEDAAKSKLPESKEAAKSEMEPPCEKKVDAKGEKVTVNNALLIEAADGGKTESDIVTENKELSIESYLPQAIPVENTAVCRDDDDACCEIVATINDENQLQIEIIGQ